MFFSKRATFRALILMSALFPPALLAQDAHIGSVRTEFKLLGPNNTIEVERLRIPANVTGHSGDRDRFAHGLHAGESFVR